MKFVSLLAVLLLGLASLFAQRKASDFSIKCPMSDGDLAALQDTPEGWSELSEKAKVTVLGAARAGDMAVASSWVYVHLAAEFFNQYTPKLSLNHKILILKNLTAFMDFYETVMPVDDLTAAGGVIMALSEAVPNEFERHLPFVFALSLVFDAEFPEDCVDFGMPGTPSVFQNPQDVLLYMDTAKSPYDLNSLAVCELIWLAGMYGPVDELRKLRKDDIPASYVERLHTLIKTDRERVVRGSSLPWNEEIPYTPENIAKYGGVQEDKTYYAYRFAQANLIPVICYKNPVNNAKSALALSYMWKPGVWKLDFGGRIAAQRSVEGTTYNPQTWTLLRDIDIDRLTKRGFVSGNGVASRVHMHISKLAYDAGDLKLSEKSARSSIAADSLNKNAYDTLMVIRARMGASTDQINSIWRSKLEAFKDYPVQYIDILVERRENLEAAKLKKESDHFFWSNLRAAFRANYDYAIEVYTAELMAIIAENETNRAAVLPPLADMCRASWVNMKTDPFEKVVTPVVTELYALREVDVANKALAYYETILRRESSTISARELRAQLRKELLDEDKLDMEIEAERKSKKTKKLKDERKKKAKYEADVANAAARMIDAESGEDGGGSSGGSSWSPSMSNAEADDALLRSVE